ncbi:MULTISPECIES: hypothetical protein [unclassified Nocardioides]|uniref:hypothetical protein n=1 Tax=unclassified Nocardioides TaxID=2615069 RepID=UPI0030152EF1
MSTITTERFLGALSGADLAIAAAHKEHVTGLSLHWAQALADTCDIVDATTSATEVVQVAREAAAALASDILDGREHHAEDLQWADADECTDDYCPYCYRLDLDEVRAALLAILDTARTTCSTCDGRFDEALRCACDD